LKKVTGLGNRFALHPTPDPMKTLTFTAVLTTLHDYPNLCEATKRLSRF
jgi:hypothetical protein